MGGSPSRRPLKMLIVGIDWSITSPALTIFDTESNRPIAFYAMRNRKRLVSSDDIITLFEPITEYENDIERFDKMANLYIDVIKEYKIKNVFLEGFAYRAMGNTYSIGESTAMVKYYLWKAGINLEIFQPSAIKKDFTDKGNASKTLMWDTYSSREEYIDFIRILNLERRGDKIPSPVDDIVDSLAIAEMGAKSLAL